MTHLKKQHLTKAAGTTRKKTGWTAKTQKAQALDHDIG